MTQLGPVASVIVCAYTAERWSLTCDAIHSVRSQTVPCRELIVVVDYNESLRLRLLHAFPELVVIPNEFDQGLSGARNTGVKRATCDVIAFLDDDARADKTWLAALLAPYEDPAVVGVGGKVLPEWTGLGPPTWLPDEFLWVVGCSYLGLPVCPADVRNPVGANMSFRLTIFERIGGFNAAVGRNTLMVRPMGCEETEFGIRVHLAFPNGRIMYQPDAVVYHSVDASRATWKYFLARCFAEGLSKHRISRSVGTSAALTVERRYLARVVTRAAARELRRFVARPTRGPLGKLVALALGVIWTTCGYVSAAVTEGPPGRRSRHVPRS